jgi:hypothetical protein
MWLTHNLFFFCRKTLNPYQIINTMLLNYVFLTTRPFALFKKRISLEIDLMQYLVNCATRHIDGIDISDFTECWASAFYNLVNVRPLISCGKFWRTSNRIRKIGKLIPIFTTKNLIDSRSRSISLNKLQLNFQL